jgi:hypothetical protein
MIVSRKLWTGALVAAAMTVGSVASAAAIDDFTDAFTEGWIGVQYNMGSGQSSQGTESPAGSGIYTTTNSGVGFFDATRMASIDVSNVASDQSATLEINSTGLATDHSPFQGEQVSFWLDYFDFGGTGAGVADLSNWSAFQFSVLQADLPFSPPDFFPATWTVTDTFGNVVEGGAEIAGVAPPNVDLYQTSFGSMNLTNGVDFFWDQVANIQFRVDNFDSNGTQFALDMTLGHLAVVPVPPAAGLILLGMVGVSLRRKFMK